MLPGRDPNTAAAPRASQAAPDRPLLPVDADAAADGPGVHGCRPGADPSFQSVVLLLGDRDGEIAGDASAHRVEGNHRVQGLERVKGDRSRDRVETRGPAL